MNLRERERLWNHQSEGSGLNMVVQEERGRPFRKDCGDDKAPQKGTRQAEELVRVKTERWELWAAEN